MPGTPAAPATAVEGLIPSPRRVDDVRAGSPLGHLHQVDVYRLVMFTSVIGVHAMSAAIPRAGVAGTAALALMQVTRKAFFVMLALVAVLSASHRPVPARVFWRRRLSLIGVPYALWTLLYGWGLIERADGAGAGLVTYLRLLTTGQAHYHLYFLLASMQLYAVFPALLTLLRRTARWHAPILATSLLLQVALHWLIEYVPAGPGFLAAYQANAGPWVVSYQFWILLGMIVGLHYDRVHAFIAAHAARLVAVTIGAGVLVVVSVHVLIDVDGDPRRVSSTFSPFLIPWYLAAICGVYALGTLYARRVAAGGKRWSVVEAASQASFGVYLIHPFVLPHVEQPLWGLAGERIPPLPGVALVTLLTAGISLIIVLGLCRTVLSRPMCGRERSSPAPVSARFSDSWSRSRGELSSR